MVRVDGVRRLIVNADDFGASRSVNQAVRIAHEDGILSSASLMVGETGFEEAVALARENPRLGVGLHLTLVQGRPVCPAHRLPGILGSDGNFFQDPVRAGLQFFRDPAMREPLRREIAAQLQRFADTGLPLDHVNGHLHLHLHPVILELLLPMLDESVPIRLTRDRFWLNAQLERGRWWRRAIHALVFHLLSRRAAALLRGGTRRYAPVVFGLLQTDRVNASFVRKLIPRLPKGDSELYSHPCLDKGREELDALVDPRVRELLREHDVRLIRHRDL